MLIMDVPSVPVQRTPIVLAQATSAGVSKLQPDFILNVCAETESTGDPMSAMRGVDPAGWLGVQLENRDNRIINYSTIKLVQLESTAHGKLNQHTAKNGQVYFMYDPQPNYVGNDQAVFLAEFDGKVYRIVIKLVVSLQVNENPLVEGQKPVCPPAKLIKVTKPTSGSLSSTHIVVEYSASSPTHRSRGTSLEARRPST